MRGFALLLDSGATLPLKRKIRTREDARAYLAEHNAVHRDGMAERVRCSEQGDYMNFPMVLPRLAVGLICPKPKHAGASQMGSKGGRARAASLSPSRRKEIARKAALARWRA